MEAQQELLTRILTSRINTLKSKGTTDFTEIEIVLKILLAGGGITSENYATLTALMTTTA